VPLYTRAPNVETLGYSRSFLRDEEGQILAALDKNVRAPVVVPRHAPNGALNRRNRVVAGDAVLHALTGSAFTASGLDRIVAGSSWLECQ
jgi:hypothetical protein